MFALWCPHLLFIRCWSYCSWTWLRTPTTVSRCITTLKWHLWLMTHCGYYDFQGDAIWQLFVLEIFLLFLDRVSHCLLVSYQLHCRKFCSGQGIHWKLLVQVYEITVEHLKSLKLQLRMETLLKYCAWWLREVFLPSLSQSSKPLDMSLLVSQTFFWLRTPHWGQKIPPENCLYCVRKFTVVYRIIMQCSTSQRSKKHGPSCSLCNPKTAGSSYISHI